jgi:Integrase core domain.
MAPAGCTSAGVTASPTGEWTVQQARNLALSLGERFEGIKFLVRDRGSNFTASFDAVFRATGARILRTAVQAPRMNAICERLIGTLRRELLDRVLIISEQHLPCGVQLLRQRAELGRGAWLVNQHGMIGRCVSTRDLPDVLPNPGLARAPRPQQRR